MSLYFLDRNSGKAQHDAEYAHFESVGEARAWADGRLFALAMEEVARGHESALVLLMRDGNDRPIYRASLVMQGTWLRDSDG